MKLKIALCLLTLSYLIYISYLDYKGDHMPQELTMLFHHVLFRLALLISIAMLGYRGHLECAILLSIAYLISICMSNREGAKEAFTEYLTMQDGDAIIQDELRDEEIGSQEVGSDMQGYAPSHYFNPQPYRDNQTTLASGIPDALAPNGDNFLSNPSGPYADSGVAYKMDMA